MNSERGESVARICSQKRLVAALSGGARLCRNNGESGAAWFLDHGTTVDSVAVDRAFKNEKLEPCGDGLFGEETSQTFRLRSDA